MELTKPSGAFNHEKRADCLGISEERFNELNVVVLASVAYLHAFSAVQESGVLAVSVLTQLAWPKANIQNLDEDRAFFFIAGEEYGKCDDFGRSLAFRALIATMCEEKGWNPEDFATHSQENFDKVYEYAKSYIEKQQEEEEEEISLPAGTVVGDA